MNLGYYGLKDASRTVIVRERGQSTTKTEILHSKDFMKEERNWDYTVWKKWKDIGKKSVQMIRLWVLVRKTMEVEIAEYAIIMIMIKLVKSASLRMG